MRRADHYALILLVVLTFVEMLGEIILDAHLTDGVQLAFEIVDVFFFVDQDFFEQGA